MILFESVYSAICTDSLRPVPSEGLMACGSGHHHDEAQGPRIYLHCRGEPSREMAVLPGSRRPWRERWIQPTARAKHATLTYAEITCQDRRKLKLYPQSLSGHGRCSFRHPIDSNCLSHATFGLSDTSFHALLQ